MGSLNSKQDRIDPPSLGKRMFSAVSCYGAVEVVSLIFLCTICLTEGDAWNMDVNPPLLGKGLSLVGQNNLESWFILHYLVASTDRSDLGCGYTFRIRPF